MSHSGGNEACSRFDDKYSRRHNDGILRANRTDDTSTLASDPGDLGTAVPGYPHRGAALFFPSMVVKLRSRDKAPLYRVRSSWWELTFLPFSLIRDENIFRVVHFVSSQATGLQTLK